VAVTVTDKNSTVIEMNEVSEKLFEKYGGYAVLG
jgi:hypothetical protein